MDTKQDQFERACRDGDLKTVKVLINDPDVDPSARSSWAILCATYYNHKEIVELLAQDSRVDYSNFNNFVIRYAAYHGHKDIVNLLLADKRVMDNIEYTLELSKGKVGYSLLKTCVDKYEFEVEMWEQIAQMGRDADIWF